MPRRDDELITPAEAGRRLGLKRRAVRHWMQTGKLPTRRVSPRRRFVNWTAWTEQRGQDNPGDADRNAEDAGR